MTPVTTVEESPALSTLKQLGAAPLSPMSDADEQAFGRLATDSRDTAAMLAELEASGYRFAPPLGYWTDGEAGSLATVAYFGSNGHEAGTVVAFFGEDGQPVSTIAFEADGDRGLIAREMGPSGLVLLPELPGTPPEEMERCVEHVRAWKRANIHFEPSRACAVNTRFQQYLDLMLQDLGVSPYRKLRNPFAGIFIC